MQITPADYDNWYRTSRGQWISEQEFALLMQLLPAGKNRQLLDVGCGTGHFCRRFNQAGLVVTGLDPDPDMIDYARKQSEKIDYLQGRAEAIPFADRQFDYSSAITSLCFVDNPIKALQEIWRVSKYGVILGLLNRHSLLHRQKVGRGAYAGARWDTRADVVNWLNQAGLTDVHYESKSAIFFPGGGVVARLMEKSLPGALPWGGFLAMALHKSRTTTGSV